MTREVWVFVDTNGSEILVEQYDDGSIDVATRPDSSALWSPPLPLANREQERAS